MSEISKENQKNIDPIIKEIELKMILDVNIPNQAPLDFTSSLMNLESNSTAGFSRYPYFTTELQYPESIKQFSFQDKLNFFFNKSVFLKILKQTPEYVKKNTERIKLLNEKAKKMKEFLEKKKKDRTIKANFLKPVTETVEERNKRLIKRNNICRKNIMFMLSVIFPTKYYETTVNTYDELFTGRVSSSSLNLSSVMPIILNYFISSTGSEQKYSYLNIPSKGICTINRIAWLNDIYNHPEYKKLVEKFIKYNELKLLESLKMQDKIEILSKIFKKKYSVLIPILSNINITIDDIITYNSRYRTISEKTNYLNKFKKLFSNILNVDSNFYENLTSFITLINLLKDTNINNVFQKEIIIKLKDKNYDGNRLIKQDNDNDTERIDYEISAYFINFTINELIKDIEKILTIYDINDYLTNPNLDINFNNDRTAQMYLSQDDIERKNKLERIKSWKGYSEIVSFTELIKKVQKLESSNIFLQRELNKYIKNRRNKIEDLIVAENSKSSSNINYVDTGISIPENSNALIYLRVDVIGGKVDDNNRSKVKCVFDGDKLGNDLELLLKPNSHFWELDKHRFFFDVNKESSVIIDENKNEIKSLPTSVPGSTTNSSNIVKKQGGSTIKLRVFKNRKGKTLRNYK
jgi:hypothetical protein